MSSSPLGEDTSPAEVTNISPHGFWMLTSAGELFLSFEDFPWFREASVAQIVEVEELGEGHYHWPALDVDLSAEIISHPERFPLVARDS